MDYLKMAAFFCDRITNIIIHKKLVEKIEISYQHDTTFGNEYVRVSFVAELNEKYFSLSKDLQSQIDRSFSLTAEYIFSLSKRSEGPSKKLWSSYMRLMEFKHIYNGLAAYAVNHLEQHFPASTFIKVQSTDLDAELNRCEICLSTLLDHYDSRELNHFHYLTDPGWYYRALIALSAASKSIYTKAPEQFEITDQEIFAHGNIDMQTIHRIIIDHRVPIVLKGYRFIEKIHVHLESFCSALSKEAQSLQESYVFDKKSNEARARNIEKLNRVLSARSKMREKEISPKLVILKEKFPVNIGDILELKSGRLVIADTVKRDGSGNITVQYLLLKRNLMPGIRSNTISIRQISHILLSDDFQEYLTNNTIKTIPLLRLWMQKYKRNFQNYENSVRRMKVVFTTKRR